MGSENSTIQKKPNNDVIDNINKLFNLSNTHEDVDAMTSLHINDMSGGSVYPTRQRYKEYEIQLGGQLKQLEVLNTINNFSHMLSGGDEEFDSDLEFDDTEHEHDDELVGGNGMSATSANHMSEIQKIKTDQLSPTSHDVNNLSDTLEQPSKVPETHDSASRIFDSEMAKLQSKPAQTGGETLSSLVGMEMFGGKQSSDEVNIMPIYSSASQSEYYNDMQKEHSFT
jgi:hypothetical protein